MEAKNPLSLAELVRFLLFFYDEEFTDDPQQQQQQQQQARATVKSDSTRTNGVNMPHIKGVAIENVLMFVYQKYCRLGRRFYSHRLDRSISVSFSSP